LGFDETKKTKCIEAVVVLRVRCMCIYLFMNEKRYKINAPSVVSEVIDGEAVIVNMDNGNYYSIDDSGAFVWDAICRGANLLEIRGIVERSYSKSDVDIDAIICELLEQFLKEELLVEASDQNKPSGDDLVASSFDCTFSAPELKKYTDMEELLLLDPIHDEGEELEGAKAAE